MLWVVYWGMDRKMLTVHLVKFPYLLAGKVQIPKHRTAAKFRFVVIFFPLLLIHSTVKFVFCRTVRGYHNFKRAT